METICSRLHDLIDGAAGRVTISGVGVECLNLHFLDSVLWWRIGCAIVPSSIRRSIHQELARLGWCPANAPSRASPVVKWVYQRRITGRNHTDRQLRNHDWIPAVQRKIL